MKKPLLALACLACATPVWAADVGVGVSVKSNDSTIYVPIDVSESFRIEPLLRYRSTEQEQGGAKVETDSLQLGVGLFGLLPLGESVRIYLGGRLAYLDSNLDFESNSNFQPDQHESADGYRVSPTFGFEYLFNEHLSLGGEAEWFYQDMDVSNAGDAKATGTETRLILRLRF